MSSQCPYCKTFSLEKSTLGKTRQANHQLMLCSTCSCFSIEHVNGKVYPLDDKTSPDGDPITRVI